MITVSYSDTGASWDATIREEDDLSFTVSGLRRERTGIHGTVTITYNDYRLGGDNLNLEKDAERTRLANACFRRLLSYDPLIKESIAPDQIGHWLDDGCIEIAEDWEDRRFDVVRIDPEEDVPEASFPLSPYVLDGGGTILFGVPGSGKSTIAQAMACCIASGISTIWKCEKRPVLYVNLERAERSFKRREYALRFALGIDGSSGVEYIHARGATLKSVERKMKTWSKSHVGGVVILDSVSRAGLGSLNDDTTGNSFADIMNAAATTWIAIAHTSWEGSRDPTQAHEFGSIMFRAGEDIGVSLTSAKKPKENKLGIALRIVKANDIPPQDQPQILSLEFQDEFLIGIHKGTQDEYPKLFLVGDEDDYTRVTNYLEAAGEDYGESISSATGVDKAHVHRLLKKYFVQTRKEKNRVYYGVKAPVSLTAH